MLYNRRDDDSMKECLGRLNEFYNLDNKTKTNNNSNENEENEENYKKLWGGTINKFFDLYIDNSLRSQNYDVSSVSKVRDSVSSFSERVFECVRTSCKSIYKVFPDPQSFITMFLNKIFQEQVYRFVNDCLQPLLLDDLNFNKSFDEEKSTDDVSTYSKNSEDSLDRSNSGYYGGGNSSRLEYLQMLAIVYKRIKDLVIEIAECVNNIFDPPNNEMKLDTSDNLGDEFQQPLISSQNTTIRESDIFDLNNNNNNNNNNNKNTTNNGNNMYVTGDKLLDIVFLEHQRDYIKKETKELQ